MLAPMPVAAALDLNPIAASVIAPFALGLNGNAITVSTMLWRRMVDEGAPPDLEPAGVGAALAKVIARGTRPRLAMVHQHSAQNYELRYWLAACGIQPDRDVELVVVPPPLMTDALKAGAIDGHCVAEPWGSVSVLAGVGRIATTKSKIWPRSPEKVLGVSASWSEANPDALAALLRALYRAAIWCADPTHREEAAAILARPAYLGLPETVTMRGLCGRLEVEQGLFLDLPGYFIPDANYPWPAHAAWFYGQMLRWGHAAPTRDGGALAAGSFRPDLFAAALPNAAPAAFEPAPFFDGHRLDPG
jgi:NitT/TauT family transport system ATP-binding protein